MKLIVLLSFLFLPFFAQAEYEHDGYIVKYSYRNYVKQHDPKDPLAKLNIEVVDSISKNLENDSTVLYIEPNYLQYALGKDEPRYESQWALPKIEADKAWDIAKGSHDVVVAVIDTGVDYTHEDLVENIWINPNPEAEDKHGFNFVNNTPSPMDDHGHGTHCAGVIGAAHNGVGIAGVNAHVSIMGVKFLSARGSGTTDNAIRSIIYAVDNGAHILSNSWGGGAYSEALKEAIEYARDKNVLFVAAAGNSNTTRLSYPASYEVENVISVASSMQNDRRSFFSNYGVPHVHIAAPGSSILSTVLNNRYSNMSGTSMATPYVSGAAALLLSHQYMDYAELKQRIFDSADVLDSWDGVVSTSGRLNVNKMLLNLDN